MSSLSPSSSFLFLAFCCRADKTGSQLCSSHSSCNNRWIIKSALKWSLTASSPPCRFGSRMGSGTVRFISEWISFSSVMFMMGSWRTTRKPVLLFFFKSHAVTRLELQWLLNKTSSFKVEADCLDKHLTCLSNSLNLAPCKSHYFLTLSPPSSRLENPPVNLLIS